MTTNRISSSCETWIEVVDTAELANVTGGFVNPKNVVRAVKAVEPVVAKMGSGHGLSNAGEMFNYIKKNIAAQPFFSRPVDHNAIGTLLGDFTRGRHSGWIRFS